LRVSGSFAAVCAVIAFASVAAEAASKSTTAAKKFVTKLDHALRDGNPAP
jgi:hypothetical protein